MAAKLELAQVIENFLFANPDYSCKCTDTSPITDDHLLPAERFKEQRITITSPNGQNALLIEMRSNGNGYNETRLSMPEDQDPKKQPIDLFRDLSLALDN